MRKHADSPVDRGTACSRMAAQNRVTILFTKASFLLAPSATLP